ncbi:MAG: hypothetical protein ACE5F4_02370 [Candidatus Paceibacteria bacterium]
MALNGLGVERASFGSVGVEPGYPDHDAIDAKAREAVTNILGKTVIIGILLAGGIAGGVVIANEMGLLDR